MDCEPPNVETPVGRGRLGAVRPHDGEEGGRDHQQAAEHRTPLVPPLVTLLLE